MLRRVQYLGIGLWLAAVLGTAHASPHVRSCEGSPIEVTFAVEADFSDACHGAREAIDFVAKLGVQVSPIAIEIVNRLPAEVGGTAAGAYVAKEQKVYMLSFDAMRKAKTWFKLPINRETYRSLAIHETTHALVSCHFGVQKPSIQAKEYVAYVAMFSMMPTVTREKILRRFPGKGFENEDHITAIAYMFDPMHFGVESYRHYRRNGKDFLQDVLAGDALTDE